MKLLYDNQVDINTLIPDEVNLDYPINNLKKIRLSEYYRLNTTIERSITISGTNISATYFSIIAHNISNDAVVKLIGKNDLNEDPIFEHIIEIEDYLTITSFEEKVFNYWIITIDDPNNINAFIKIGRLFLGSYLQLPGAAPNHQFSDETTTKVTISDSGQPFVQEGVDYRTGQINYPSLTDIERNEIRNMFAMVRNKKPIILIPWDDLTVEKPIHCLLDQKKIKWKITGSRYYPWSTTLKVKEVF